MAAWQVYLNSTKDIVKIINDAIWKVECTVKYLAMIVNRSMQHVTFSFANSIVLYTCISFNRLHFNFIDVYFERFNVECVEDDELKVGSFDRRI